MSNFFEERDARMKISLEKVLPLLPPFALRYFGGTNLQWWSKRNYAQEIRHFFMWLLGGEIKHRGIVKTFDGVEEFKGISVEKFTVEHLNKISNARMEEYMSSIRMTKGPHTLIRRIATLRSFFKYFHIRGELVGNVTMLIEIPKPPDKPIVTMTKQEAMSLFSVQPEKCIKNVQRNRTILLCLLETGIRVSELVGLNMGDICLEHKNFVVTRKGGNKEMLFMNKSLSQMMYGYIKTRLPAGENEPLFISNKKVRITIKAVQDIVAKYRNAANITKHITPHKLRSTFGTALYETTRDIYMVAACLGHSDVNTTRKHYARVSDGLKREAMRKFKMVTLDLGTELDKE